MGKTAFALNTVLENIHQDNGVVIFSLDMPEIQLILRMLSSTIDTCLQDKLNEINPHQREDLGYAIETLRKKNLFINDSQDINIKQFKLQVEELVKNKDNNIKLVVIDNLQLITQTDSLNSKQNIKEICIGLKQLAKEMNISILLLSQLTSKLEKRKNKRPILNDIDESEIVEQYADKIICIYRDSMYQENEVLIKGGHGIRESAINTVDEAEIIIRKHRNGDTGTINLLFDKAITKFIDI